MKEPGGEVPPGYSPLREGGRRTIENVQFHQGEGANFPIKVMCDVLGVSEARVLRVQVASASSSERPARWSNIRQDSQHPHRQPRGPLELPGTLRAQGRERHPVWAQSASPGFRPGAGIRSWYKQRPLDDQERVQCGRLPICSSATSRQMHQTSAGRRHHLREDVAGTLVPSDRARSCGGSSGGSCRKSLTIP